MAEIQNQLAKMNIQYDSLIEICSKAGIRVYRLASQGRSYVLKYFGNQPDRREIENYRILASLGIPTIRVIASTCCALLMEDIQQSRQYRLGRREDLDDCEVAKQIAKWYQLLHSRGKKFVDSYTGILYDESDCITRANIHMVALKTQTKNNPLWNELLAILDLLNERIVKLTRTLTYNDFYYTNLIVALDKSSAFMFDYNLLGKGYVYGDLRNVTNSLSVEAGKAFLQAYGEFDQQEVLIDEIVAALVTLHFACQRDVFPQWAAEYIQQIHNGELLQAVRKLTLA